MYKITLLVVGTLKESYWREAQDEYLKRLRPFAVVDVREIAATPFRDASDRVRVMKEEGERILASIPQDAHVIAMDKSGKQYSSELFSQMLERVSESGRSVVFIIGGALGLSDEVKKRADALIAFGDLTFPHQLIRIVLVEQLYRAATIAHGKAYHY